MSDKTNSKTGTGPAMRLVSTSAGVSVALVTQPYRISRTRAGSDEASLDAAWRAVWPIATGRPTLVIPRSATMRLITDMASQWIERQLAQT